MNAAKVRSGQPKGAASGLAALALLAASTGPAFAGPLAESEHLWRHGSVSRHFWAPSLTSTEIAGMRLSAGLAVGVRRPLRATVGSAVAPAIVLTTGQRSNLTLLPTDQRGAMLVWQLRN